jgi:hypothetical protein
MNNETKSITNTIKYLSKILKEFPSSEEESNNEEEFDQVLKTLNSHQDILNSTEENSSPKQIKLQKFFKSFVKGFIMNCGETLKTSENFSLRIESGDYLFKTIEFLTLNVLKKPSLNHFFEFLPDVEQELKKLILHNIVHQDCFLNGNEFTNVNIMKLILVVLHRWRESNKNNFQKVLPALCHKIIDILGVCSFDCTNFEESIKQSLSEGNKGKGNNSKNLKAKNQTLDFSWFRCIIRSRLMFLIKHS